MDLLWPILEKTFSLSLLSYTFLGVFLGMLFGAMPGMGSSMGMILLLPTTFAMDPASGLSMLIAIYVGAMAGDAIPAVTVGIPGTAGAAVDVLDGYPLMMQGKGEKALNLCTMSSSLGNLFSAVLCLVLAAPLAKMALHFGPCELFWLGIFGLGIVVVISSKEHMIEGIIACLIGIFLSTVGLDFVTGEHRYTFNNSNLYNGLGLVPALTGFFAIAIIFEMIEDIILLKNIAIPQKLKAFIDLKDLKEIKNYWKTVFRSASIGTGMGILPGVGAESAGWIAYTVEKNFSKNSHNFGKGAIEGLICAETANNAVVGGALIPLFALGIPGSGSVAVLMGGFNIHGLAAGPSLFFEQPVLVYSIISGLIISSLFLIIIGLSLRTFIVKLITITPYSILITAIFLSSVIGCYGLENNIFDVYLMLGFGVIGYILKKINLQAAAVILGMILGPFIEQGLRQGLLLKSNLIQIIWGHNGFSLALIIVGTIIILANTCISFNGILKKSEKSI